MIPLRDINPTRRFPIITVTLIAVNTLVFIYELNLSDRALNELIMTAGVIPYHVTHSFGLPAARDLITSMFLHGGWMHLLSNMLYLWIFGNNIEDVLGPFRFTFFYLLCGVVASLAQVVVNTNSGIPTIGASGAVAGVLGAYILLFPNARVQSLVFVFYFIRFVEIPAVIVLGFWFILQFFNGLTSLGVPGMGGVAYFAHIGGFVAGMALIHFLRIGQSPGPPPRRRPRRYNVFRNQFPDLWE